MSSSYFYDGGNDAIPDYWDGSPAHHAIDGREQLTEDEVREYLTASGYAGEADQMIADSLRWGNWRYTADRHRTIVHEWVSYPGEQYWLAADCSRSEDRLKALSRARRGR